MKKGASGERRPGLNVGALWLVAALSAPLTARGATSEVGPGDDVEGAMNALAPGDELVLRGGTYTLTDAWHVTLEGTAEAPILVRAKDGERPHLDRPAADQNIIDFDRVRYAELRGIEVSGGSAGLRLIDVSFMTIRDCEVHGTADVAISANSGTDYEGLRILRNHVHDTGGTGEGMYLGCNGDGCRVHDSLFEGNHVHHTNGATVKQGDGIEIKEGSYGNVVRDNVIHDTGYPCIITYGVVGNGPANVIERNVMWNCGDHAIQSAADVIIRNNVILGSAAHGIANQPHQAATPGNIQILHNTILHPLNDAIASTGITGSVVIANNAVYAPQGNAIRVSGDLAQVTVDGNVGVGALSGVSSGLTAGDLGVDFVAASFSGAPPNDVFPKAGSALIAAGNPSFVTLDDFNGTLRYGVADVGAYASRAAGNPGWVLGASFKDASVTSSGGDSGVPTGAGGAGGSPPATGGATATGGGSGAATGGATASEGGSGPATGGSATGAGGATASLDGSVGDPAGAGGGDVGAAPGASKDPSGCACRTAPSRSPGAGMLPALLGLLAFRRRGRAASGMVGSSPGGSISCSSTSSSLDSLSPLASHAPATTARAARARPTSARRPVPHRTRRAAPASSTQEPPAGLTARIWLRRSPRSARRSSTRSSAVAPLSPLRSSSVAPTARSCRAGNAIRRNPRS